MNNKPRSSSQVRQDLNQIVLSTFASLPPGHKGAVTNALNRFIGNDADRRLVLGWLFGNYAEPIQPLSSKRITEMQWYNLYNWIGFEKDEDTDLWRCSPTFPQEAAACLTAARLAWGQLSLQVRADMNLPDNPPELSLLDAALQKGGEVIEVFKDGDEPAVRVYVEGMDKPVNVRKIKPEQQEPKDLGF